MQSYNINPRVSGINEYGAQQSDTIYSVKFDGTATASITVPGSLPMGQMGAIGSINPTGNLAQTPVGRNKYLAVFHYGTESPGDVWVSVNGTVTVPSTNAFVLHPSELFPPAYEVFAGDVIEALCSTANQTMSVAFYHLLG